MSILDKVTKAVGDVVDKGKKDLDQFMKVQKINGEIGGMETKIAGFNSQIQALKQQAGEKAIELIRAGTLASPEIQGFFEQIRGIEQQISAEETTIAERKADIEKIKAEPQASAATPPPGPVSAGKFCPQCGAPSTGSAFCPQCGAKLG
jgi:hypothetical protein